MSNNARVVIVGAGFGGLGVAEELAHVPVDVTLIDRHNYHTFQPLLYQVATSLLNAEDVGAPVRSIFRHQDNVTFRMATVTGVDTPSRKVQLDDGSQIACDYQRGKKFHLMLRRITRYKLSPTRSSQHLLDPPDLPCTIRTSR